MTQLSDLSTGCNPTWCPGCGDIAIWAAFKNACVARGWDDTNTSLVAGVGCHGHMVNYVKITSVEGLHGRALPMATGIKMANSKLNVFVFTGDGDSLAEGGNHFVNACRRNHDITIILHDNAIYGLTTGQTSPRSPHGFVSKSTPFGNLDEPISPVTLALASGATFVAREYASHIPQLAQLFAKANDHKGIAIIDVLQPCVTWNDLYDNNYYQQNTYYLPETHDKTNLTAAFEKSLEWGEKKIPLGIFYQVERPSYEDQIPQIKEKSLTETPPTKKDLTEVFQKYT
jgi:2-oxoglutarate ferredoxin oxidoreductase subunit beta